MFINYKYILKGQKGVGGESIQYNFKAIAPQAARSTNTESLCETGEEEGVKSGLNPELVSGFPNPPLVVDGGVKPL